MNAKLEYKRKPLIDCLVILFGISSWVAINGLWVQTPLLVDRLPEAWDLAFYIVIITQLANIGPVIYSLLKRYEIPNLENVSIHCIMLLGTIACLVLALSWDTTAYVGQSNHSIVFLCMTGLLSVVDCTSSVLFFPFIANYRKQYLSSLLIGEGLSGVVPSFAALIQGVGGNPACVNVTDPTTGEHKLKPDLKDPLFSVNAFFFFLTSLMCTSWFAFFLLTRLQLVGSESLDCKSVIDDNNEDISEEISLKDVRLPKKNQILTLLFIQSYGCFLMNGFLSALSTYSLLPYGNTTYHWATILTVISGPAATLLVFLIHKKGSFERAIYPLVLSGSICASYLIFLAWKSPSPPLVDSSFGSVLAVLVSITCHASFSYIKACIAGSLRECSLGGRRGLYYYGVATQCGSLTGALLVFCLMRFGKTFHAYHPC